jgi:hypothetical protein
LATGRAGASAQYTARHAMNPDCFDPFPIQIGIMAKPIADEQRVAA